MRGRPVAGASLILLVATCVLYPLEPPQAPAAHAQAPAPAGTVAQRPAARPGPTVRHPLSPELRGDLFLARGQYMDAIKAYREVPSKSASLWNRMGIAWQHLFATDEALEDYQRALRMKPNYPEAINNLGTIYYEKKNYKKAEKLYHRALKFTPQSAALYNNMGAAYFAQGKLRQGAAALQKAFAIDPGVFSSNNQGISELGSTAQQAEQNYCMAELFAHAGMNDRAIEYLRKALAEGFKDRKRVMSDRAFVALRQTDAFAELMGPKKRR